MKRSILLLTVIAIAALLFSGLSHKVETNKSGTCCQEFEIVSAGTPLSGCVISIVWPGTPLQCNVDPTTGRCTICDIPAGNTYLVEANCDEKRHGSTKFKACNPDEVVRIFVP
jgi:hypothetical protein